MRVCLPALAILVVVYVTDSIVLCQGAELGTGGRKAVLFVSTLEAGKNTLAEQILTRLHLQEMVQTNLDAVCMVSKIEPEYFR